MTSERLVGEASATHVDGQATVCQEVRFHLSNNRNNENPAEKSLQSNVDDKKTLVVGGDGKAVDCSQGFGVVRLLTVLAVTLAGCQPQPRVHQKLLARHLINDVEQAARVMAKVTRRP